MGLSQEKPHPGLLRPVLYPLWSFSTHHPGSDALITALHAFFSSPSHFLPPVFMIGCSWNTSPWSDLTPPRSCWQTPFPQTCHRSFLFDLSSSKQMQLKLNDNPSASSFFFFFPELMGFFCGWLIQSKTFTSAIEKCFHKLALKLSFAASCQKMPSPYLRLSDIFNADFMRLLMCHNGWTERRKCVDYFASFGSVRVCFPAKWLLATKNLSYLVSHLHAMIDDISFSYSLNCFVIEAISVFSDLWYCCMWFTLVWSWTAFLFNCTINHAILIQLANRAEINLIYMQDGRETNRQKKEITLLHSGKESYSSPLVSMIKMFALNESQLECAW